VALNGSGVAHRYTRTASSTESWRWAPAQVTACTFGGPGLGQLFITTSRENLAPDDDPLAGSLFRADVGVRGRSVREFAG
jgi:sugar lactone lactonase YvrE